MGAREIGFTIVSMTASLAAVFLPVLFMGGIVGRLLHEFAVVIGAAVIVSGVVSLTLTPMALQPLPAAARARPTAASTRRRSASSPACSRSTSARSSSRCAIRAFTLGVFFATLVRDRLPLHDHPQGLHPQRGHRAGLRVHRGRAGHLLRGDDGAPAQGRQHRQPAALRGVLLLGDRGQRLERGHEHRPHLHAPQARHRAAHRGRDREGPAAEDRAASRASTSTRRCCPPSGSAASSPRASTSTRCRTPTSQVLYQWAPILYATHEGPAGLPRRQLGSADHEPAGARRDRPREGLRPGGHRGADRGRAQQRLRLPAGLDDLHPDQPVLGDDGAAAAVPARSRRALAALHPVRRRQARARSARWPS